jgi:hypothetical protein
VSGISAEKNASVPVILGASLMSIIRIDKFNGVTLFVAWKQFLVF